MAAKAKNRKAGKAQLPNPPKEVSPPENQSILRKLLDFVDQPLFHLPVGILGGLMGLFFYTPLLVVCGICILLAFHRAKVVADRPWRLQTFAYIVLFITTTAILFGAGLLINQNVQHIPTAREIASEINNVFQSNLPPAQEKPPTQSVPTNQPSSRAIAPISPPVARPELSKGPRLGIGPDAYKELTDEQVGQWAVEEADKIEKLTKKTYEKIAETENITKKIMTGGMLRLIFGGFTREFYSCCAQDLIDLRTEIFRRLGPPSKDPKEAQAWSSLIPGGKYVDYPDPIDPRIAVDYATHLRFLGLKLKRRDKARISSMELRFTEEQIAQGKEPYSYRLLITINTKVEVRQGYIVFQFVGEPIIEGCDLEDASFISIINIKYNEPLENILSKNPYPRAIQIGKIPFVPAKPMNVVASNFKPFHVRKIILFDL